MLARKLGHFCPNTEHPINAVWARFAGVKEWDSYEWRERFPDYANGCRTAREWATNHLFGRGWWVWIIPLQGGGVSAGTVYDSRIFKLLEGPSLGQRLHAHILSNPIGREIFGEARVIEGDVHALSMLPYRSEKVCGTGWPQLATPLVLSIHFTVRVWIFVPTPPTTWPITGTKFGRRRRHRIRKQIRHGLLRWWKCELINLGLMLRGRAVNSAAQPSAQWALNQ
jgi:hypothetical protein